MKLARSAAFCLLALVTLASCQRAQQPAAEAAAQAPATFIPTPADIQRFRAEGPDPTLRRIAAADYFLHYRMMQATGLEQALGGEEAATAALQALGNEYERRIRAIGGETPKLIRAAFTGEGMASGFVGMGMGSFLGMLTGGMLGTMVSTLPDDKLAELVSRGPLKFDGGGGKAALQFDKDGSLRQSMEFDVNEHGINGKVKMTTRMTGCPDENGKVEVEIDVDSQMSATDKPGTGGYVHSTFKYERYLDDDAQLISTPDGSASSNHIRMGGFENFEQQYVDVTVGYRRGGERIWDHHDEGGFSIFRMEEADRTRKLLEGVELLQTLVGEMMLRGMTLGSPWESGRCIDLQVTSVPGARKGLKVGTPFQIDAKPRVKSSGQPAGGAVSATLAGGSALSPAGGKVPADAKYAYAGPDKKNETASITFEARSKRGVGKATLDFDTRTSRAYHLEGTQGEFHGVGDVCDLEETFVVEGNGVTVRFEPDSAAGGRYTYSGAMTGDDNGKPMKLHVHGKGTYVVKYAGDVAVGITAHGPGTVETPFGDQHGEGSEDYTLTPLAACPLN